MITYDDFHNWLAERAAMGRVFVAGHHPGGWVCNCPIASYAVEKLGMPAGNTAYSGTELVTVRMDGSFRPIPADQQPDELFWEFARRVDDACQDSAISAATALAILEAVT